MGQEFTIKAIVGMLKLHVKMIILITFFFGFASYAYSTLFITPLYSATSSLYLQNTTEISDKVLTTDLSAGSYLAKNCMIIFKDYNMLSQTKEQLNLPYSVKALSSMISITNETNTQILYVTVSSSDPKEAAAIANKIAELAPAEFDSIIGAGQVKKVDSATVPTSSSYPNVKKYTFFGIAAGLFVSVLISMFLEIIDTSVKPHDDLFELYGIPVFAEILDFNLCKEEDNL